LTFDRLFGDDPKTDLGSSNPGASQNFKTSWFWRLPEGGAVQARIFAEGVPMMMLVPVSSVLDGDHDPMLLGAT
jgi:hypothetical protein